MSVRIIEASLAHPASRVGCSAVDAAAHLDTFPPVLIAAFGERWFEDGSLSLQFHTPTAHGEPVRAGLMVDDQGTATASLVTPDGVIVADGTATVGATAVPSARADHTIGPAMVHCPSAAQSRRVVDGLIAAPIEWYHGPSPWGPSVTALSSVVEMFTAVADEYFAPRAPDASGAFTALELRYHGEPVLCDVEYAVEGRFLPDERTPRGDAVWCDMTARDQHGHLVASARMRAEFATAAAPGLRADRSPATARAHG